MLPDAPLTKLSTDKLYEKIQQLTRHHLIVKAERDELKRRVRFLEQKIERIKSELSK